MMTSNGFILLKEQFIPEIDTLARLYSHQATGAQLLSLENHDENKVFGITFRTPPPDSTGIAHIMEHSVLCGSHKYPVKEPFIELVKGSLKTFINAFTYPDKTCYPVASQNLQDFYNLIDVYMDAVLHPILSPYTLQQEGWHYELESLDQPLSYKGVVYNEMKGAYSSPDDVLARISQQSMFPDNVYGVDSGGDPRVIPELTYTAFKRFHEEYYHPGNALIYFYGDDDPQERLRRMDDYLKGYGRSTVDSSISLQPPLPAPRWLDVAYVAGEELGERQGMATVNWLLSETADPETTLGLHILAHLLIGTPASPLRKALIDSGLGEDLAGVGLESELRQMYFSTGLKGIAVEDAKRVEQLAVETLQNLTENGIEKEMVEAAVNTIEFRLRENNTGAFPRGLSLMLRALTTWLYNDDPFKPLAFEQPLEAIKKRLAAGERYFEGLIQRYFINNPHRTTVLLKPDPQLRQRREAEERERLDAYRATLSASDLQAILENTQELQRLQKTPDSAEALRTIPSLRVGDLEKKIRRIPLETVHFDHTPVLYHDLFTNGILYLDLGFNLKVLPPRLLPFAPLFGRALLEMGTEKEDYVRLSQRIGRLTGGITPSTYTTSVIGDPGCAAQLFLRSKAMAARSVDLLQILRDVLLSARLDNQERFRQMVLEEKAEQEAMLAPAGHRLVNSRLRAGFNAADWAAEQMGGISYLFFLRQLAEAVDKDWKNVLDSLVEVRSRLVNRGGMLVNVTMDEKGWQQFRPQLQSFINDLPDPNIPQETWDAVASPAKNEGLTFPAQVNFVGKGFNLYQHGYSLDGSIFVVLNYLRTTWLWERVRVQGGAYGGFCLFDHRSGVFTFLSYRDPNLENTLQVYDQTGEFLKNLSLSADELEKSIIGVIGDLDAYQLPDAKGFTSMSRYLSGDTDEIRQQMRDQVLSTSSADFRRAGEILEHASKDGKVVVLGSPASIASAAEARPGWLEVQKIL